MSLQVPTSTSLRRFFKAVPLVLFLGGSGCTKPVAEVPRVEAAAGSTSSSLAEVFERSVAARGGRVAWQQVKVVREFGTTRHERSALPTKPVDGESSAGVLGTTRSNADLSHRFTTVLAGSSFYTELLFENGRYYEAGSNGDKVWKNGGIEGTRLVEGAERVAMLEPRVFFDDLDWRRPCVPT